MSTVNKVILVGRLGTDPESRVTPTQTPVCQFPVATNHAWTDRNGEKQEEVCWHRVVVWGKHGEVCREYLSKGRQVYVEGRLRSYSYTDGEGRKRFATEVVSDTVVFLGKPANNRPADGQQQEDRLPF